MATIQKKVCMLGSYAVGKSSLVRQFISSMFDDKYLATLGVKVDKKSVTVDGNEVMLMLWDVAGAEDHFSIPMSYCKGSAGYLLVIDSTRRDTLDRALDIAAEIERSIGRIPVVVALTKIDLTEQWALTDADLAKLATLNCPIIRSSAKTGEGVEQAFAELAKRVAK